jgi:hypothetical protein
MYEYKLINMTLEPRLDSSMGPIAPSIEDVANRWAQMGWRVVSYVPPKAVAYAECLLLERIKPVEKPIDTTQGSIEDPDLSKREREFRYGE